MQALLLKIPHCKRKVKRNSSGLLNSAGPSSVTYRRLPEPFTIRLLSAHYKTASSLDGLLIRVFRGEQRHYRPRRIYDCRLIESDPFAGFASLLGKNKKRFSRCPHTAHTEDAPRSSHSIRHPTFAFPARTGTLSVPFRMSHEFLH